MEWMPVERPGYFGRRRDAKVKALNDRFGVGNWKLGWIYYNSYYDFLPSCRYFYERAYFQFLQNNPAELEFVCGFENVIDNATTNIQSGMDYSMQEAFSTHIQDIAVRNVVAMLGRRFEGDGILTIRGPDSNGAHLNPGQIPFYNPTQIDTMGNSLAPKWAKPGSVEDFWQNNKWILARE